MLNHSPGPLVTVLTLLTDGSGRSLLTRDADDHEASWALPGGALCPGELPTAAAHRALCDQLDLGLTFAETDLLATNGAYSRGAPSWSTCSPRLRSPPSMP